MKSYCGQCNNIRTYALNTVSADCTIPPAVATPLDKGGRGDPNAIGSASNGDCVSPEYSPPLQLIELTLTIRLTYDSRD
jgi:hypothetical protein